MVAPAWALAEICLTMLATRTEDGKLALWKTVTMSSVLFCLTGAHGLDPLETRTANQAVAAVRQLDLQSGT